MSHRIPIDQGVTLFKQKHCASWFVDIVHDGNRTRKSLGTSDREKARVIAKELASSIIAGQWNIRLAAETTLERAVEQFRDEYEMLHHAPSTRKYTQVLFARFREFIRGRYPNCVVTLDTIRRADIEAYQLARASAVTVRDTKPSAATVNRDLRDLSVFFEWSVRRGTCRVNPCKGVKPIKGVVRVKKPLTPDEIKKLLDHLPEILGDVARLILNCGLRLGEALHLRAEDVDLASETFIIRSRPDYPIKTRQEREIRANEAVLAVLRRRTFAAVNGVMFPSGSGTVINNRNSERELKKACDEAEIRQATWYLMRKRSKITGFAGEFLARRLILA